MAVIFSSCNFPYTNDMIALFSILSTAVNIRIQDTDTIIFLKLEIFR